MYAAKPSMSSRRNGCNPDRSLVLGSSTSKEQGCITDVESVQIPLLEFSKVEIKDTTDSNTIKSVAADRSRGAFISDNGEGGKVRTSPEDAPSSGGNNGTTSIQKRRDNDSDDESFLKWITDTINEPISTSETTSFIANHKSTIKDSSGPTLRYSRDASKILRGNTLTR